MNHDLERIPTRKLEIINKTTGSGTYFVIDLTDDDVKQMKDSFSLIDVEMNDRTGEAR